MQKHRRFGDRKDGRRLRTLKPIEAFSPYIMVERSDAQNFMRDSFHMEKIEEYIREKRRAGLNKFGFMHVLVAAYVRAISQLPGINRFLSGQKVYARNDIQVCMVVKRALKKDEMNTVLKVVYQPEDTAEQVYARFSEAFDVAFAREESDFDVTARKLNSIPGLIKKFAVWVLRLLDYFGGLPCALTKVSPFHGSLFITSMGSLDIPPIYHHLYNFGNVPVFCAFGAKRTQNELADDGSVVKRKYIDCTFVTDERICDGFYFASALKLIRRLLANPWQLDAPPQKVVTDID